MISAIDNAYRRNTFDKFGAEHYVCIVEHALFQRNNDELRVREVFAQHLANILRMREIQCGIHLIQNIPEGSTNG